MQDYRNALLSHLLFCGASNAAAFVDSCDDDEVIDALLPSMLYRGDTHEHARMASSDGAVLHWPGKPGSVWDLTVREVL